MGWEEEVDLRLKAKNTSGRGHQLFSNQKEAIALLGGKESVDLYTFSRKGTYRIYTYNENNQLIYSNMFQVE
jgi:hypothetical protein